MLRIEDLCLHYGNLRALDGIDLSLSQSGRIHGIIGPNGAGKSTLMDVISGRRRATSGRVWFRGVDVGARSAAERRRLGISRSFQRTSIFPTLTVIEQLELVAARVGGDDIEKVISALELNRVRNERAETIAYGDQRRVDVALALLGNPRLLLLDEPAAGLSRVETTALFEHVTALVRERDVTAMIVEHDVEAVFGFCDDITVLDLGRLLMTGEPDEVRRDPKVIAAYLGSGA